ncbi:MAG: signal peptide peptidase SppA [Thermoflexales bacterium]|nr:signal peptide peptidase SppA [Thermoflexales bacterium]MDW8351034.1 signal peptide peptidase SppA [Anaerolineae bacterium]
MSSLGSSIRRARLNLRNRWRGRHKLPPFVIVSLEGEVVELPPARPELPFFGLLTRLIPALPAPLSVSDLRRTFEQLAHDPRVKGVVLKIGCVANPAVYQSLRDLLKRFRTNSGKRLVAYAESFGPFQYYLACACDQIVMPPSAEWNVLGLRDEYTFLKDALDRLGVGVDVVNVSPFKSAGDIFARNDFSPDSRAQAEWLLDARFDALVQGIAEGRKLSPERVRELIDCAPLSAQEALQSGLLDAVLYEDQLERFLVPEPSAATDGRIAQLARRIEKIAPNLADDLRRAQQAADARARRAWINLEEARKMLLVPIVEYAPKVVGVIKVEGLIVPGVSRRLPLPIPRIGEETAGADSIAQAIRHAEADDRVAAVILYVNSGGGSVLGSDLIAREVRRLRAKKPVVVYMGGTAASGGYYVSALANYIVAQPLTITGSIGVIALKPNARAGLEKLGVHRVALQRGKRAGLFSDVEPMDEESRTTFVRLVARAYDDFKRVVAEGRAIAPEVLESISGGRVWTGAQAKDHQLVDALGDFTVALERARELAGLPGDKRAAAIIIAPPRRPMLPPPLSAIGGSQRAALDGLRELRDLLTQTSTWAVSLWHGGITH